jgi:O-acetylhomoserine (thiol)-lyase
VEPGLVRLAVGLEHIDDIIKDLEKGFAAHAAASDNDDLKEPAHS